MRETAALRRVWMPRGLGPVPFKTMLPLRLRDRVSGKGTKGNEVRCLLEMSVLFACLKEHEFQQAACAAEADAFQRCYVRTVADRKEQKATDAKGALIPGQTNLSHKQTNALLKSFPASKSPPDRS